jgi:hypothetical protein
VTYLIGIDVSSNNSSNWEDDAWDYCWVKATEGKSYKNPDYAHQTGVVRNRDKVLGHYHWLNDGDVMKQVDWFCDQSDVRPGDLIACDWEDPSNPTTAQKDEWIRTIQHEFPDSMVGLYCNKDWWINHDTSSFFGNYLWIANYTSADNPGIKADWTFWQYTFEPYDKNRGKFASLAELKAWAGGDGTPEPLPPDPGIGGVWFSTDYLFPQVKPNPTNPNAVKKGDEVEVTASGGLTARSLPGGPQSVKDGQPVVRDKGYRFDVTGDLVDGWVTGGTNWYSSDYLKKVTAPAPPATPSWSSKPTIILPMKDVPGDLSYIQDVCLVNGVTLDDGTVYDPCWIVAQDYNNAGDIRFLKFDDTGKFQSWFQVNDAGHGSSFYAYRSAAGNLYVWCGEDAAYRHSWQSSKKVGKTSGDKMDYKGARPMGGYGSDRVAFRNATDTKETFSIFDRTDFTDGSNRTKPIKEVTISKQTARTQQTTAASESRIYRLSGSTNDNPPHGTKLHVLEVFDWAGKRLLEMDVTAMYIETTSDEPEGLTFSGNPGSLMASKREGSTDPSKRSVPVWTMSNLP